MSNRYSSELCLSTYFPGEGWESLQDEEQEESLELALSCDVTAERERHHTGLTPNFGSAIG